MPSDTDMQTDRTLTGVIAGWVDFCQRRAGLVVSAAVLISVLAAVYLAQNIRIDTNTEDMLSASLPFRQNAIALDREFPILEDNLLVVLEAPNGDAADDGARRLVDAMRQRPAIFGSVFAAETDPFLLKNGFLYLDTAKLDGLATRLAAAQPFLGTLWQAPNLEGLAEMLALLGRAEGTDTQTLGEANGVLERMADVAEGVGKGGSGKLVWSAVLLGVEPQKAPVRRLIFAKPNLDYATLHPAARAHDAVYEIARELHLDTDGLMLRLTGSAALESDELKSVEIGMGLAGLISLVLVIGVLWVGLRSIGVMLALIATLLFGLLSTAALAILMLGSLNLISVAFAVLFVGLSVDFGIHYALRVAEHMQAPDAWRDALVEGGRGVGPSLLICTLTTAIAFFSFAPTAYVGLAELGLIAGVGMVVALLANMTVLPALLRLFVLKPPVFSHAGTVKAGEHTFLRKWARTIVGAGIISALLAGWLAKDTHFDFDPMNLKDPGAPSMQALFDLWEEGTIHPYSAEILIDSLDDAKRLMARLEALESVAGVDSVLDLVPPGQADKLEIIDRMALLLGPAFFAPAGGMDLSGDALDRAVQKLNAQLAHLTSNETLGSAAKRLAAAFEGTNTETAARINHALFAYLPARLRALAGALEPDLIDIDGLPDTLKRRYLSEAGKVRLDVIPKHDLRDQSQLRRFVQQVQSVAPQATGAPVIIVEAGRAVIDAFMQALGISLFGISIILWLVLRRVGDVLLVFAPVIVAAIWTLAVSVLFDVPFNFANVIVLPLLFGLSVDYGVHLVLRQRHGDANPMLTTTPRAVLMSALTTIGSFGSIMLSGHPGTASMGVLLSIAIALSLLSILVFLPALMHLVMPQTDRE